jgi:hypothetical protein
MDVTGAAVGSDRIVSLADDVEDRHLRIELLALLIVVGDPHVRALPDLAGVGLQFPNQHPQQRRLARAILADQADAIAAHDAGGKLLQSEL